MTTKTEPLWTLSDLTTALECSVDASQFAHQDITGVSIDTRTLEKGDLFVALKGDLGDGQRGTADVGDAHPRLFGEAHVDETEVVVGGLDRKRR